MTEYEWLTCDDPQRMLELLTGRGVGIQIEGRDPADLPPSDRNLRLFVCGCCRRSIGHESRPSAVDEWEERGSLYGTADPEWARAWAKNGLHLVAAKDQAALLRDIIGNPFRPVSWTMPYTASSCMPPYAELRHDRWGLAYWIAVDAYQERRDDGTLDPVRLAILADALEDAGCAVEELMRHLRGEPERYEQPGLGGMWLEIVPGPHVRGCWALDLILGKE